MAKKYPKAPKRPKRSASLRTWENYNKRHAEWRKRCSQIDSERKRKENLMNKNY